MKEWMKSKTFLRTASCLKFITAQHCHLVPDTWIASTKSWGSWVRSYDSLPGQALSNQHYFVASNSTLWLWMGQRVHGVQFYIRWVLSSRSLNGIWLTIRSSDATGTEDEIHKKRPSPSWRTEERIFDVSLVRRTMRKVRRRNNLWGGAKKLDSTSNLTWIHVGFLIYKMIGIELDGQ